MALTQEWVTLSDLAAHLGVTRDVLYGCLRRGELRASAMPRHYADDRPRRTTRTRWRIARAEVERFITAWRSA